MNFRPVLSDPVAGEPVAAPAAPVLDKATIDRRKINRDAMKHWAVVQPYLYDWKGFPTGPSSLDPSFKPSPNGEKWPGGGRG
jgi:hypothetical protein